MKECGNSIRQIRRNKDLTQEYMALELGISQKAYSDLENCKVKMNMTTLLKVADILEISPSEICSLSGNCTHDMQQKHESLLDYLKQNNIQVPDEYL
ncbi:helix-turn-helix transcriptional regulator [Elizabethkingia anophelis]|uniref:Antitoxin HipB n=1 Tax=Elizabethkingia anophelis TaxID=1117645 RepID=A0A7Z7PXQ1_9FLAO|nr:helix-turn-helix transcriptional regulator [Elizabethkingia anophelis]MCT3631516.1 helix-turn-helix transcriptional regulator [Elizabethkingia anophelis]MCT3634962.1 helix-turn-helix transcriptional regulator [Elizabethkingia anophelis]MCT3690923.1 helix-turn-helix transcriptional regulator [Elizabethkingia anophelis]MCT3720430.1 helix-turn-helix transcriptional regulator [Elizabethkingia anophelis]MCT3723940.1 helix-turn-helix transcriptional regulator [Elizabethkingia anophelis]